MVSGAPAENRPPRRRARERGFGQHGIDARVVRNGSRGLFWLEPLVEVATASGRVAYGPVTAADVPMPYSRMLEKAFLPQPEKVVAAVHEVLYR